MESSRPRRVLQRATQQVFGALNRADEIGGEVRDWIQERLIVDPRYVAARRRLARLFGREYESATEQASRAAAAERARAAAAAPVVQVAKPTGLGDPGIKAQIYGKKSCAWTGRAITILEKHKVDFDFTDLDDPEYENLLPKLMLET